MRVLSLFSGVGGFDLAFKKRGHEILGWCEIDPFARKVMEKHFPDARNHSDVRFIDGREYGSADVVCGGFPCQDISLAGCRKGLGGTRSSLYWEAHRIIGQVRPEFVLLENVPGLLSSCGCDICKLGRETIESHRKESGGNCECGYCKGFRKVFKAHRGNDLRSIIYSLNEIGYGVAWTHLDSQYYGLAQRRQRIFIAGCLGELGARKAAEILALEEGLRGVYPESYRKPETVAGTLTVGSKSCGSGPGGGKAGHLNFLVPVSMKQYSQRTSVLKGITHPLMVKGEGFNAIVYENHAQDKRLKEHKGVVPTLTSRMGTGGGNVPLVQQSHTVVRRLTERERERLQGFPDDWTRFGKDGKELSGSQRYKMMGNAVSVNVIEAIVKNMEKEYGKNKRN